MPEGDAADDVEPGVEEVRSVRVCGTRDGNFAEERNLRACGGILDDVHRRRAARREDVVRQPALKLQSANRPVVSASIQPI